MIESAPYGRGQHQTASNWHLRLSEFRHTHALGERGTGFSYRRAIDLNAASVSYFFAIFTLAAARSQSERVLGLPEAAGRRAEGRVSGKSARSEAKRAKRRAVAVAVITPDRGPQNE